MTLVGALVAAVLVQLPEPTPAEPVEKLVSFEMESRDGILLRNGKPHFWVGNGTEFGAIQSGPVALWLAWLHGYTAVSLYPGVGLSARSDANGDVVFSGRSKPGNLAWYREVARLGFLSDFFGNATYRHAREGMSAEIADRPEVKEVLYDLGHYLSIDVGSPTGRQMALARRIATARQFDPADSYLELCREPGPNPSNRRVCDGFRSFVRAKYADDLALANRLWRTDYASWGEVVPRHLDAKRYRHKGSIAQLLRRRDVKRQNRAMYWDWFLYLQQDTALSTKGEIDDLHAAVPGLRISIDQRAHQCYNDGYASYDPEVIDPLEDIFSLHQGWQPHYYDKCPYDEATLMHSATFGLFDLNFFRSNTAKPMINAEDIISVARAPVSGTDAMAANDLAHLHETPWKFARSSKSTEGAERPDFDDAGWDDVKVPGCWDETAKHAGYSGSAWYRKRFRLPQGYKADYDDGSRRFLVYGKGVAQKGKLFLNGKCVGTVSGWDKSYSFDVGALIDWSGENVIAWQVEGAGKSENGLRFYCHLLAHDMIMESRPFGEKQYRQMLFTQLMRGLSGCMVWSWHSDYLRPYMPDLFARLQTAAEIALPSVRNARSRVAYLYGYASNFGLPASGESGHERHVAPSCALEALGFRPDVFGERHFRDEVTSGRYALVVVPATEIVHDETYAAFKRYVQAGGTAVIGEKSLRLTFERYQPTDIETFDRGKGRVIVVPEATTFGAYREIYAKVLPKPEVGVACGDTNEVPVIERMLCGEGSRRLLYLSNWGGFDHDLTVTLPQSYADWTAVPVVGACERRSDGSLRVPLASQDVAAIALSAPETEPVHVRTVSPCRRRIFDRVLALNRHVPVERADTLFPLYVEKRDQRPQGAESFPYLLDRVEAFGLTHAASEPDTWTDAALAGKKLVVLTEGNSCTLERVGVLRKEKKEAFVDMIVRYVESGGSLLVISDSAKTANVKSRFIRTLGPRFGIGLDDRLVLDDGYAHGTLKDGKRAVGSVLSKRVGKGRVTFVSDVLRFQPFAIERGTNAEELVRTLGFLLNRPVTDADVAAFRANLFLTEAHLKQIDAEEGER